MRCAVDRGLNKATLTCCSVWNVLHLIKDQGDDAYYNAEGFQVIQISKTVVTVNI